MATRGRKFPNNKKAGRNVSEPTRSLVNYYWRSLPLGYNPGRGKGSCFVHATKEPRVRGLPSCCSPREVTRKLQRKLYAKAKQETAYRYAFKGWVHRRDILSRAGKRRTGKCACLGMKSIGKPCAGIGVGRAFAKQKLAKLHARFDEGGQARACFLLYPFALPLVIRPSIEF